MTAWKPGGTGPHAEPLRLNWVGEHSRQRVSAVRLHIAMGSDPSMHRLQAVHS